MKRTSRDAGKKDCPSAPDPLVLYEVCYHGQVDTLREALKHGADVNAAREETGENLLHGAAWRGYSDIVRLLLDHGADVEGTGNYRGFTPLHVACRYGQVEIVKLLLEAGADGMRPDANGKMPLDHTEDIKEVKLEDHAAIREQILELFQEHCPEAYFTAFCTAEMKL